MRYVLALIFLAGLQARAQALRDINYNYSYDPAEPFMLTINAVRTPAGWTVVYNLTLRDSAQRMDQFNVHLDLRPSLDAKEGTGIDQAVIKRVVNKSSIDGEVNVAASPAEQFLSIRILNNVTKRAWIFYEALEPNSPVNGYITSAGKFVGSGYVKINSPIKITPEGDRIISFYKDDFPAAVPAFSEGMGKVARSMTVDTLIAAPANTEINFSEPGLYLVQKDTNATEGFAFRVQDDYPRLQKVQSIADPLIYVCTKQEFDKIKAAKGDKKAFDRVILSITGNTERARNFMRNYFRRVEWANYYFTSYKEGWKTDRGMIYILFGLPEELYKFSDREVWTYNSAGLKATFQFVKSSTVFDPDNYVLVREKKFQETWYEKVDLWRNARF